MILLDTNVIVDALDKTQTHHSWSKWQIEAAVAGGGGGISVVTLAELCAGARNPDEVEPEIKRWGITVHDVPAAAAAVWRRGLSPLCHRRDAIGGQRAAQNAVAGFLIGRRRREIMGWKLPRATGNGFKKYFPNVSVVTP